MTVEKIIVDVMTAYETFVGLMPVEKMAIDKMMADKMTAGKMTR
jgi:hypothetical protein